MMQAAHLNGNKNYCFVTMPMKGVYKLQMRNLQTSITCAQYNVWLLSPAKQAQYTNSKSKAFKNNLKFGYSVELSYAET